MSGRPLKELPSDLTEIKMLKCAIAIVIVCLAFPALAAPPAWAICMIRCEVALDKQNPPPPKRVDHPDTTVELAIRAIEEQEAYERWNAYEQGQIEPEPEPGDGGKAFERFKLCISYCKAP